MYRTIEWRGDFLRLLDQRELPHKVTYSDYSDHGSVAKSITDMVVRGAPAIGVAGAYGLVLASKNASDSSVSGLRESLRTSGKVLNDARPTAVNLSWAITRMMKLVESDGWKTKDDLTKLLLDEAHKIYDEDAYTNRKIGEYAQTLIPAEANVLHHCNTGTLATADYGTALGIIRAGHEAGKKIHAYLDETRPRLQGASLSAWELKELGIPHTVLVDGASGFLMKKKEIHFCVVGCDRVAANGDTANKIGTYNLAIVARAHGVPFYVAAPSSTIDFNTPSGDQIPIEERDSREITHIGDKQIAPEGTHVFNPAFDVTPGELITAIITEKGIVRPPYRENLASLLKV